MSSNKKQTKENLIEWIDQSEDSMVKFLQELISIPSENKEECNDMAEFMSRKLKEFGFDNTQMLEVEDPNDKVGMAKHIKNILTVQNFGSGKKPEIVLNAYGDTVPPGLGWDYDPYDGAIVEGKIYGRGAAIAKSDISSYTFAVLAIKKIVGDEISGRLNLAFTFDGEYGGFLGPRWLLEHRYINPDMAITPGFTHSILNAHNGCIQSKIILTGKASHATSPTDGNDALEAMNGVLQKLYSYRKDLLEKTSNIRGIHSPTLTMGLIKGGTSINLVPEECEITLDRRLIPEENAEDVEKEINDLIKTEISKYKGITVHIEKLLYAPTFGPTNKDTLLIKKLSSNWRKIFPENVLKIGGIPLYSDARHYSMRDIPTVMFGVGPKTINEANGYQANEHIEIKDLLQATKVIALTLYDLLSDENEVIEVD